MNLRKHRSQTKVTRLVGTVDATAVDVGGGDGGGDDGGGDGGDGGGDCLQNYHFDEPNQGAFHNHTLYSRQPVFSAVSERSRGTTLFAISAARIPIHQQVQYCQIRKVKIFQ